VLASLLIAAHCFAQTCFAQTRTIQPIGITRLMTQVEASVTSDDLDYSTKKTRVLLVGGVDGGKASGEAVRAALAWFDQSRYRSKYAVSAVLLANPDQNAWRGFPPSGEAYGGVPDPEAHYLWRWIGVFAPDLVIEVDTPELVSGLAQSAPAMTGSVPARKAASRPEFLAALLAELDREGFAGPSSARSEIQRRLARTPRQVADQLAGTYGHSLDEAVYIPAVALIARLRLGALDDIERIGKPYADKKKDSLAQVTGSHLSGHLVFGELARRTNKPRYIELVRAAADRAADESKPLHNEMSDSVFMGCPILAQAGALTGESRYFDLALRHMRFMLKLNLRADGLHRHSPLDETAWGRGNGFPALGLALSLSDIPPSHPGREEMLAAFRSHMEALRKHQDSTGMWHQVVDLPASYRELTATCMIGVAMTRGIRYGWLDKEKYQPLLDRAWTAVKTRVAANGVLIDVCTGTGKQKSLRDYLDRTAILDRDSRGGAMALLFATELLEDAR
jgi:rhamnogalacturonyl hydrolase YesR